MLQIDRYVLRECISAVDLLSVGQGALNIRPSFTPPSNSKKSLAQKRGEPEIGLNF